MPQHMVGKKRTANGRSDLDATETPARVKMIPAPGIAPSGPAIPGRSPESLTQELSGLTKRDASQPITTPTWQG